MQTPSAQLFGSSTSAGRGNPHAAIKAKDEIHFNIVIHARQVSAHLGRRE